MARTARLHFDNSLSVAPITTQAFEDISDSYVAPKEADFQLFQFRLLSSDVIIGAGGWNCSMFPAQVLKDAVNLFDKIPVVYNHSLDVKDAVGNVVAPYYQNPYLSPEGKQMPGGVNGFFRISKKRHPSLVYDLTSNPSPIQSTSCMIEFEWEPSHEFENDEHAFYWHIGDKINGEYVHMRATKILSVTHQGLVYDGADDYAKKLDGSLKEQLVAFAKQSGVLSQDKAESLVSRFVGTQQFAKASDTESGYQELVVKIALLEGENANLLKENTAIRQELELAQGKVKHLESTVQSLQASQQQLLSEAAFAKRVRDEKVAYAKQVYSMFAKCNPDERVLRMIERTSYSDLDALIESFGGSLMHAYSMPKCAKCGNESFLFRNSVIDRDAEELFDKEEYDIHNIIKSKL